MLLETDKEFWAGSRQMASQMSNTKYSTPLNHGEIYPPSFLNQPQSKPVRDLISANTSSKKSQSRISVDLRGAKVRASSNYKMASQQSRQFARLNDVSAKTSPWVTSYHPKPELAKNQDILLDLSKPQNSSHTPLKSTNFTQSNIKDPRMRHNLKSAVTFVRDHNSTSGSNN